MERRVIKEEDFLDEQKSYESDLPIEEDIEDIDIPVKEIPVASVIVNRTTNEDEEEMKIELLYSVLSLMGNNISPSDEEINALLSKSIDELKVIEQELKDKKEKTKNLK